MKICDICQDKITGIVKVTCGSLLTCKMERNTKLQRLMKVKIKNIFPIPNSGALWIVIRYASDEELCTYSQRTRESRAVTCWAQLSGSPGVWKCCKRGKDGRGSFWRGGGLKMSQGEWSQEIFKYLNFPDWDNKTHTAAPSSQAARKILLPSARLPEHSPLPARGFSRSLGRCSNPQAGIAASRHRASSSTSLLLLLLLSTSLVEALGAVILNHRKGLWGAPPLATLLHDPTWERRSAVHCGDCSSQTNAVTDHWLVLGVSSNVGV